MSCCYPGLSLHGSHNSTQNQTEMGYEFGPQKTRRTGPSMGLLILEQSDSCQSGVKVANGVVSPLSKLSHTSLDTLK